MSRLIFEGDTTERFGELFPKPFIEKMMVFDDFIETHIGFYFEIEEGVTAEEFISDNGLEEFKFYVGLVPGEFFDYSLTNSSPVELLKSMKKFKFASLREIGEEDSANTTNSLLSFSTVNSTFYNSEGKKFIKFLNTDNTLRNYSYQPPGYNNLEKYLLCVGFFPGSDILNSPPDEIIEKQNLYNFQFSQISYERFFNKDGELDVGRRNVFRQADGNAYDKIPLKSLDNTFRVAKNVTHQGIIELVNPIVSPYIGVVTEAEQVSLTLSQYANDPNLLTELKERVNSFSNKSTATTTGQLYSQLAQSIADIDNLLQTDELLDNRLEFNSKIKNRRFEAAPPIEEENRISLPDAQRLQDFDWSRTGIQDEANDFISNPLVYRALESTVPLSEFDSQEDALISNKVYIFFDFEKGLNYLPLISQIFNPYAIQELYGRNCLNQYFRLETVALDIIESNTSPAARQQLRFTGENLLVRNAINNTAKQVYKTSIDIYNGTEKTNFKQNLCERAFETGRGLNGYRLRAFEADYIKPFDRLNIDEKIQFHFAFRDTSMQFYDQHIRLKMLELKEKLEIYLSLAEQFCSYNNIDGRFNTFFQDGVVAEFEEPYPWEEAPSFYHSLISLFYNSYNIARLTSDGTPTVRSRKISGERINFNRLRDEIKLSNDSISPASGDLQSLRTFVRNFRNWFNSVINIGGRLDQVIAVPPMYNFTDGNPTLQIPRRTVSITSKQFSTSDVTVDIDLNTVNSGPSQIDYVYPVRHAKNTTFQNKNYIDMKRFYQKKAANLNATFDIYQDDEGNSSIAAAGSDNDTRVIREPSVKSMKDIYNQNIIGGDPEFIISEDFAFTVEQNFLPFYDAGLLLTINDQFAPYPKFSRFDNSMEPREFWKKNFNELEEVVENILDFIVTERLVIKVEDSSNPEIYRTIRFIMERDELEIYIYRFLMYYWSYSYYYGTGEMNGPFAVPITLSQFLKNEFGMEVGF